MPASKAARWKGSAIRKLSWFHRWLGIATCLIFAAWFASGAVLLFQPFPSLPRGEELAMAAPIETGTIMVSPARALRSVAGGKATGMRLIERGDTPAYIIETAAAPVIVDARTGARLPLLTAARAGVIVTRAIGHVSPRIDGAFDYDQWIVHNQFDPLRPFFRAALGDAAGTQLYISARTGEIVQRTTAWERGWNWIGAVLHWAYFTPLRSSFTAWDRTVWWISLVAMLVAVAGIILGIIRTVAVRRAGRSGLTFFRLKWMRWHHLLGLFAGLFVLTWILSGWLSMDHGRLFSRGQPTPEQARAYAGLPFATAVAAISPRTLRTLPPAREIAFTAVAGEPLLAVTDETGRTRMYDRNAVLLDEPALGNLVRRGLSTVWPGNQVGAGQPVAATDLYALAEAMPASAQRFVPGKDQPTIYVAGDSGHILAVMSNSRAAYAWIYYALHTFNFPGLAEHPLARDVIVLLPLIAGFIFSITGVVIGWQRLRKGNLIQKVKGKKR